MDLIIRNTLLELILIKNMFNGIIVYNCSKSLSEVFNYLYLCFRKLIFNYVCI